MRASKDIEEMNMIQARRELTRLPEKLAAQPATVTVTRRGKPVLAIMTWEDYEAIWETLAILSDADAVDQLRRSIQDLKEGKTNGWDEAKAGCLAAPESARLHRTPGKAPIPLHPWFWWAIQGSNL